MQVIKIKPTKSSPEVILDPTGQIKFRGRSIQENAAEFFEPVEEWISMYIEKPADFTRVDVILEYFNSASARIFITLFQKISYVTLKDKKYVINWYYEDGDEDIHERGEYFASILDIPINFIKTS
jgi:hypothetical protein